MKRVHQQMAQALSLCGLILCGGQAFGQYRPQQRQQGVGAFGGKMPFRTVFTQAWNMTLQDPFDRAKLIEVGQVTDKKNVNLLLLLGGKEVSDYKRSLLVTHWAGGQFVIDETKDFPGTTVDALLVGKFRQDSAPLPDPATAAPTTTPDGKQVKAPPKKKPAPPATNQQIVTTEGVYTWRAGHLTRLFTAPPNTRLAMMMDGSPDLVVGGQGNTAQAYVMGETQTDLFSGNPPTAGEGYVRFGVGAQEYEGSDELKMALGVRFVQSYWNGRSHWLIGIAHSAPNPSAVNNKPTDRLVVMTPRNGKADVDFWAMKPTDLEESWRSEPFQGRILDVRIGDPRSDGKESLLVLTSEKDDKERHLYCFRPQQILVNQP